MGYRNSASFGKRIEFYFWNLMIKDGLECYVPLVDNKGIDLLVRKPNDEFIKVQIKARSDDVKEGSAAQFSAIKHEFRENYYFVFYSERLDVFLIMSSEEYLKECITLKSTGRHNIWFSGRRTNKETGKVEEFIKPRFEKYVERDFSRFKALVEQ